ncbi:hypothetical protein KM043_016013 [Ampulex compressa]|nr:hypothetical protein KM043_016013 [Ampulex compressa]
MRYIALLEYFTFRSKNNAIKCGIRRMYVTESSSRIKEYEGRKLIGFSMEQIYSVVADVQNYKEFVPFCKKSEVKHREKDFLKANLVIGFPPINESYTSKVTMIYPRLIKAECTDGKLFNHLNTLWLFSPGLKNNPQTCSRSSSFFPGDHASRTSISADHITAGLTKHQAKELASKLTAVERDLFLVALKECKSEEDKAGYEGQLAAFRWRSKFGRPSKVPSLGDVDPTGTYCPVPEDWLLRKYVENVPEPSAKVLMLVAIANAIPFIGFGFLDNFIMIVAGDQIELILNKKFPISTMAAAALGNTVSDVIGIGSVHYVELFAKKVGFEPPKLTPIQLNLPRTRLAANVGRVMGVTIGCLIGMTPIPIVNLFHGNS